MKDSLRTPPASQAPKPYHASSRFLENRLQVSGFRSSVEGDFGAGKRREIVAGRVGPKTGSEEQYNWSKIISEILIAP